MPDVKAKCAQLGFDLVANTPAEFAAYIKKEVDKWAKVIKDAKIQQIQVDLRFAVSMRIVDIRETAIPLKSTLANSSFDFSEMTTSVVAVITDVDARRQAGLRLRLQFDRPLRLRRADARALHPAHPRGRAGVAARRRPATISIRRKSSP